MKCLQLKAPGRLEAAELPDPRPGQGEVLLEVRYCALCRTDAKLWKEGHRDLRLPRIPGHEIVARRPGDETLYAVWPGRSCGECGPCRRGAENLCARMAILGFHRDGGLAERVAAPESALVPVPDGLEGAVACLAEPAACALNALEQIELGPEESLLVCGGGVMGLLLGLVAKARRARPFIVETDAATLERSAAFRGAAGIRAGEEAPGSGFDAGVNAAASPEALHEVLARVRPGGRVCMFSGLPADAAVPAWAWNDVHYRQLSVTGAYGCTRAQMERALGLLQRSVGAAEALLQEEVGLADIPRALDAVSAGGAFRYVVDPAR